MFRSLSRLIERRFFCSLGLSLAMGALGGCAHPDVDGVLDGTAEAQEAVSAAPIRIAYGPDPLQFGDLRVPTGPGPHAVAVIIHGGCWTNFFGLELMDDMSDALTDEGVATWNIEYRRVGDPGGGYPNTFTDVGLAVDALRDLAPIYDLDLDRVVTVGHSAGGQLAAWVAARHRLPLGSPLRGADPLPVSAAVPLAGILDMAAYLNINLCGEFVDDVLGGTPDQVPERYAETSPVELLPLGVPQVLIHGTADDIVPPESSEIYRKAAHKAGDQVTLRKIQGGDHFVVIDPTLPKWRTVEHVVLGLAK